MRACPDAAQLRSSGGLPPSVLSPEEVARSRSSGPVKPMCVVALSGQSTIKISKICNLERTVSFQKSAQFHFWVVKEFLQDAVWLGSVEGDADARARLRPADIRTCGTDTAVIPTGDQPLRSRRTGQRSLPRGPCMPTRVARGPIGPQTCCPPSSGALNIGREESKWWHV